MKVAVVFGTLSLSIEGDTADITPLWEQFMAQVHELLQSNKELQQSALNTALAVQMQQTNSSAH